MLNGFANPSRIFGLAFKQKKIAKKYGIFYKFASKLKRCSKLPSFTGTNTFAGSNGKLSKLLWALKKLQDII